MAIDKHLIRLKLTLLAPALTNYYFIYHQQQRPYTFIEGSNNQYAIVKNLFKILQKPDNKKQ